MAYTYPQRSAKESNTPNQLWYQSRPTRWSITKRIIYPEDVNLFQVDSLANWDINIYEADEQRVWNHWKKMLTSEDIEDIDQVNKTN